VSDGDARSICLFIEDKMLSKPVVSSTVTLAGDGAPKNDVLTKTKWSECGWRK
jgi:hypothetical protein